VAEGHEDCRDVGQTVGPFIRDQNAHVLERLGGHAFEAAIYL
jgi:hypothetical protein